VKPEYNEILRAIADGKDIEHKQDDGRWYYMPPYTALYYMYSNGSEQEIRVKPDEVTVNGVKCLKFTDGEFHITIKNRYGDTTVLRFPEQKTCDAMYMALIKPFKE